MTAPTDHLEMGGFPPLAELRVEGTGVIGTDGSPSLQDVITTPFWPAYLVNTACGRIVDTKAVVEALEPGRLVGYAGDAWYPQPAPVTHPWRHMPHCAMTPLYSGSTLGAQARYAEGIRDCLKHFCNGRSLPAEFLIVTGGRVVSPRYRAAFEPAYVG